MAFGATTINFVTVACSLHLQIICFKLSDGTRHYDHACARLYLMARPWQLLYEFLLCLYDACLFLTLHQPAIFL
jgi:hypothetical protein